MMPAPEHIDATDAAILLALVAEPRATVVSLATRLAISRNTVQSRLAKLEQGAVLDSPERRIGPKPLGYPLTAFVTARVTQRELDRVADDLSRIPEVLQVLGISGPADLLVQIAAATADDLYRVAGQVLAIPGVERTETALVMRELVPYRVTPLLRRLVSRRSCQG